MYHYRLIAPDGAELGPFVSPRPAFEIGEIITRSFELFVIENVVEAEEHDTFRAYLVVRPRKA